MVYTNDMYIKVKSKGSTFFVVTLNDISLKKKTGYIESNDAHWVLFKIDIDLGSGRKNIIPVDKDEYERIEELMFKNNRIEVEEKNEANEAKYEKAKNEWSNRDLDLLEGMEL